MVHYLDYGLSLLKGEQDFATTLEQGKLVDVPNCPVDLPENGFSPLDYQGLFTYAKTFDLDFDPEKEEAFLVFDGAMVQVHVYLNGIDLGN